MAFDSEALAERLLIFGADVVLFVDDLPLSVSRRHVADQLLRSATSPGANYEEACAAESRPDFLHKLSVTLKELREARYWLRLLARTQPETPTLLDLIREADELRGILGKSVNTAKQNGKRRE